MATWPRLQRRNWLTGFLGRFPKGLNGLDRRLKSVSTEENLMSAAQSITHVQNEQNIQWTQHIKNEPLEDAINVRAEAIQAYFISRCEWRWSWQAYRILRVMHTTTKSDENEKKNILWIDESTFKLNGRDKRHNCILKFWTKCWDSISARIWQCRLNLMFLEWQFAGGLIGYYFFDQTVISETYPEMLYEMTTELKQ